VYKCSLKIHFCKWNFWVKGLKYVVTLICTSKLTPIKVVKMNPPTSNVWEPYSPIAYVILTRLKPFCIRSFPRPSQEALTSCTFALHSTSHAWFLSVCLSLCVCVCTDGLAHEFKELGEKRYSFQSISC
jgi:hypothetical protein